jgi:hypothetical protein
MDITELRLAIYAIEHYDYSQAAFSFTPLTLDNTTLHYLFSIEMSLADY